MKSTNDKTKQTTPTTLKKILLNDVHNCLGEKPYDCMKNIDQATQSIKEQLKALLPHRITTHEWHEGKKRFVNYRPETADGFNLAIDQIEKAIEEWAK